MSIIHENGSFQDLVHHPLQLQLQRIAVPVSKLTVSESWQEAQLASGSIAKEATNRNKKMRVK